MKKYKQPISVLVILHDGQGQFLLLRRNDSDELWQSVTGSVEEGETLYETAKREVFEETGLILNEQQLIDWHYQEEYEIYPKWRHRYAPGVTHNMEHVFSAKIDINSTISLSADEHIDFIWLAEKIAMKKVFSPTNQQAIVKSKFFQKN